MADIEDYISHESNLNYKSIYCEKIPELFLDKLVAKKHFSKFGKITRFILRPKRLCCTVEYETEDQAEKALMEGGNFNGLEFSITYAEREVAHVQNTEEWVDPDVQAELEAMNPERRASNTNNTSSPGMLLRSGLQTPVIMPPPRYPTNSKMNATLLGTTMSTSRSTPKAEVEVQKVDPVVRQELEAMLKRQAFTSEDKYRILEARDKLIRLMTVRQTDIKTAVSAKGTCPDMCPEKERLMREFQRQVATFELANDTMAISHRRAIKEYSRSSADQEVPHPHELRNESVLQMTMLYLMHRIMDLCDNEDTSIADWFHFVWDRTRSIRKDITQQELCSLAAVELVEQCARFHIHCAARLVAEEPCVFDKKINAENLTKCLQTLKYMYHDLRQKGVLCPRESEFRSYIILLNLGDANFLWELKQLPEQIQNSQEIRQALNFYNALQNNNFVRFFNLLRSSKTSYLSACILLRYFNKLRLNAMEAIIKSHKGKSDVFLPLAYITRVLGFEDDYSASSFLTYHGLQCDSERVLLDRMVQPDLEYSMERALKLVESKRLVSVGECIGGHVLGPVHIFEDHIPQDSFDANGYLKPEAWPAGLLPNKKRTLEPTKSVFKVPSTSAPIPKMQQHLKLQQQHQQQQDLKNIFESKGLAPPKQQPPIFAPTTNASAFGDRSNLFGTEKKLITPPQSSVFKVPTLTATANQLATLQEENIFKQRTEKPAMPVGNIFGNSTTSRSTGASNIFGSQPRSGENLFQQPQPPPPAYSGNNIFQIKQIQQPANVWTKLSTPPTQETSNILTSNRDPRLKQQHTIDITAEQQAEKRMRELEEEQRLKQMELAAERARLKALEEEQERQRREAELRRQLEKRAQQIADQELAQHIASEIESIAYAEVAIYRRLDIQSEQLAEKLLADVLATEIAEIATTEHSLMCRNQFLLERYFQQWLRHMRKKQQQRQLMESMPIWVTTETMAEKTAKMQHRSQALNLSMIKRYRHGQPVNFQELLWQPIQRPKDIRLNLCELLADYSSGPNLLKPGRLQLFKYCKLLLTLPADMEELPGFESQCNKWLRRHVLQPATPASSATPEAFLLDKQANVALCLRKLTGIVPKNELGQRLRHEADHVDGIICFMAGKELRNTRKRLHHLLENARNLQPVPVAFIAYDCHFDADQLAEHLELDNCVEHEQISSYEFFGCMELKNQFSFITQFSNALRFLAQSKRNSEPCETLEMQNLCSWLDMSLGEELWLRWHRSSMENPAFAKLCSMPQHVIGLYNEAIKRLQAIASEDFEDYAEFPKELREFVPKLSVGYDLPLTLPHFPPNWKSLQQQRELKDILKRLELPPCSLPVPEDVENLEMWLLEYAGRCIPSDDLKATAAAHAAIKALVHQLNRADLCDLTVEQRLRLVNHLSVIKPLAFAYATQQLQALKLPSQIIYNRASFEQYLKQPWWLNYKPIEAVTVDYSILEEDNASLASDVADSTTGVDIADLSEIMARAERVSRKAEKQLNAIKPIMLNDDACELKRHLDESFYQFDLAKQCGYFDIEIEDDVEELAAVTTAANRSTKTHRYSHSPSKKRKRQSGPEIPANDSDLNAVIAKAMHVIEKVEFKQDRVARLKRTALDIALDE